MPTTYDVHYDLDNGMKASTRRPTFKQAEKWLAAASGGNGHIDAIYLDEEYGDEEPLERYYLENGDCVNHEKLR